MSDIETHTVITCPSCRVRVREEMPVDTCQISWTCRACGAELNTGDGGCCIFCDHGTVTCPPAQARLYGGCCGG